MRGKEIGHLIKVRLVGITPAYAGKRACCWGHPAAWGDHPRTCGEKAAFQRLHLQRLGSPPHMRGKAIDRHFPEPCFGITPAHAGKSRSYCNTSFQKEDHPRTCGEKRSQPFTAAFQRGSPPHMRGKAVAGSAPLWVLWDHPRTCGEKPTLDSHAGLPLGSPPHMRGKVERCILSAVPTGITPAHAGKSFHLPMRSTSLRDHPRTCGEKLCLFCLILHSLGSPPHMRGKESHARRQR